VKKIAGYWTAVLLVIIYLWVSNEVARGNLIFDVGPIAAVPLLETCWHYAILLLLTLFFPFIASFDKRIDYFSKWPAFFKAALPVALLFILWDVWFTKIGVWGFNADYFSGITLLGLPWEEWAFFFVIPFSCLFIYESVRYFFPGISFGKYDRPITLGLAVLFLAIGFAKWSALYTATTFLLSGFFCLYHYLFMPRAMAWRGTFYLSYLLSWIPFLLINGSLTGSFTSQPVVVYNPAEYLGIRVGTIPLDDSVYSFLLLFSVTTLYEFYLRKRKV